jgi:hypothetical protein
MAVNPNYKRLLQILKEWLNQESSLGIHIKDIFTDYFVAKILANIIRKFLLIMDDRGKAGGRDSRPRFVSRQ